MLTRGGRNRGTHMSRQPDVPEKHNQTTDNDGVDRRDFLHKASAASLATGIGGIATVGVAAACWDCEDGSRTDCSDVNCVNCSNTGDTGTYIGDSDRWRYWEGGTWDNADYKSYEELNNGLVYFGTVANCSNQYVHQFRYVAHGRREVNGRYDSQFNDHADIRGHSFRIWEDDDRGTGHSVFSSNDSDELAGCPVPSSMSEQEKDVANLVFTAGSAALAYYNPYIGAALTACELAGALTAVATSPTNNGQAELVQSFDYDVTERPHEVGHFVDFYVETDPGVNCKINAGSEMQGEGSTSTQVSMNIDTPYSYSCPDRCVCSGSTTNSVSTATKDGVPIPDDVPKERVTIVEPHEQDRYVLPSKVRDTDEKVALMFLPVKTEQVKPAQT